MLLATPPDAQSPLPAGDDPRSTRLRWVYFLAVVPSISEWVESGSFPVSTRDAITHVALTVIILLLARLICRQADRLDALAHTDSLTGLWNRRAFGHDLAREVTRARRMKTPLCLAYLDVDGFKAVNDRFGHAEGDALLACLAGLLSTGLRGHVDSAYRLGGDEFAILLPGADIEEARAVLDRLCRAANDVLALDGASLSIGVAELGEREAAGELVTRADELMYEVKLNGRRHQVA